jgi:hypothetical protein
MASFDVSSQNTFDTFSHLLDNVFLEALYQYSHGCKISDILHAGDWMAEGYETSNQAYAAVTVAVGLFLSAVAGRIGQSIKGACNPRGRSLRFR